MYKFKKIREQIQLCIHFIYFVKSQELEELLMLSLELVIGFPLAAGVKINSLLLNMFSPAYPQGVIIINCVVNYHSSSAAHW